MAKFLLKGAVLGATVLSLGLTAGAANAATDSATAKAKVLKKLSIEDKSDLDFGRIVPSDTAAGPVTLDSAGVKACGVHLCPDAMTRASFEVKGTKNTVVTVSLPTPSFNLVEATDNTLTMPLALNQNSWTLGSITLSNTGQSLIYLGGTLQVAMNQAEGDYSATFSVSVDYQ